MSGQELRKSGPIGHAPHTAPTGMSQTSPVTANTVAREHAAHNTNSPSYDKEIKSTPGFGELGTRGHGGAG